MLKEYVPLEDDETIMLADWLRASNIPFAHVANESRSSSKSAMIRGAKLKRMGQSRGVWDMEIFIPSKNGAYKEARIEMKRRKGGQISKEQKEWGEIYEKANIKCKVCKGSFEAIEFVRNLLLEEQR